MERTFDWAREQATSWGWEWMSDTLNSITGGSKILIYARGAELFAENEEDFTRMISEEFDLRSATT